MPLTLNVGISKKVGLPDFGSIGATCNVTVELDVGLFQTDLETFHRHVRGAYVACAQAVNDELARQQGHTAGNGNGGNVTAAATAQPQPGNGQPTSGNGKGHTNGNGQNGNGNGRGNGNAHQASEKQMTYLRQLAAQVSRISRPTSTSFWPAKMRVSISNPPAPADRQMLWA